MTDIADRLHRRYPAYLPTEEERLALEAFFLAHPASDSAYFFYDGRIIDGETYWQGMTSRVAQLIAISTDGFPILVSRRVALNGPVKRVPMYGREPDARLRGASGPGRDGRRAASEVPPPVQPDGQT